MIKGFHYGREKGPCPVVPGELTGPGWSWGAPVRLWWRTVEGKVVGDPGVQKGNSRGSLPVQMGLVGVAVG